MCRFNNVEICLLLNITLLLCCILWLDLNTIQYLIQHSLLKSMSLSIQQKKFIKSLHLKKNRAKHELFLIEGEKMVDELVESEFEVMGIFATSNWKGSFSGNITEVSDKELASISTLKTPNNVLAVAKQKKQYLSNNLAMPIIALDTIQDPGNLGTIIRTADWFGIKNIVCSESCVEIYNSKVVQATMGSIFRLNILITSLADFFKENNQLKVYGAMLNGENCFQKKLIPNNSVLLMGNESTGINPNLHQFIHEKIAIPKFGHAESLNVSIATGVLCAEFLR